MQVLGHEIKKGRPIVSWGFMLCLIYSGFFATSLLFLPMHLRGLLIKGQNTVFKALLTFTLISCCFLPPP